MKVFSLNDSNIFVKGFRGSEDSDIFTKSLPEDVKGDLFVVVSDLQVSGAIRIKSAVQSNNGWTVTDMSGVAHTIPSEPAAPRQMFYGRLVTNVHKFVGVFGEYINCYDVVFPDANGNFPEVEKAIQHGSLDYRFAGFTNRAHDESISSSIAKLWKDEDGHIHGLTVSGSHYFI